MPRTNQNQENRDALSRRLALLLSGGGNVPVASGRMGDRVRTTAKLDFSGNERDDPRAAYLAHVAEARAATPDRSMAGELWRTARANDEAAHQRAMAQRFLFGSEEINAGIGRSDQTQHERMANQRLALQLGLANASDVIQNNPMDRYQTSGRYIPDDSQARTLRARHAYRPHIGNPPATSINSAVHQQLLDPVPKGRHQLFAALMQGQVGQQFGFA